MERRHCTGGGNHPPSLACKAKQWDLPRPYICSYDNISCPSLQVNCLVFYPGGRCRWKRVKSNAVMPFSLSLRWVCRTLTYAYNTTLVSNKPLYLSSAIIHATTLGTLFFGPLRLKLRFFTDDTKNASLLKSPQSTEFFNFLTSLL